MVNPEYKGKGIINLMSSIKYALGGKSDYAKLGGLDLKFEKNLVLFVIDGLGYEYLAQKQNRSFLFRNLNRKLVSVFPSSTASAITTLMTGLTPLEHGIPGWRVFFPELGGIIHPLPFNFWQGETSLENKNIIFPKTYSKKSFYQEIKVPSFSIARKKFANSLFTLETQRGAARIPFGTLDNLLTKLKQVCKKQGRKFVFTYWNDFDFIAHRNGTGSDALKKHFTEIDRKLEKLKDDLQNTGTKLLITADHGHLNSKYIFLGKDKKLIDCLAIPLCGEVRFAYCYVKPEKEREFKNILKNKYQKYLTCYKSSDLIKKGMFGLFNQHKKFSERIGNYTLILKDNYALADFFTLVGKKEFFKSNHGGLSKEEMFVPLISIDC
jgi:hypothetical protein